LNPQHATWNKGQHLLQDALADPLKHPEWLDVFLSQHGQLHSRQVSDEKWTFEDEVLDVLDEAGLRAIPPGFEHSIAWILWHLARCEDLTMNMLVGGIGQVLERQGWKDKLHAPFLHTGNEIDLKEVVHFSQTIDLTHLRAYRSAVGESTRQIVRQLSPSELHQLARPERMNKVRALGMVLDPGILNYWSRRTIAGLLLMPPTRHCFTHLNEAARIKKALH
jgi:uncharacterized damage-inducible protein DinB